MASSVVRKLAYWTLTLALTGLHAARASAHGPTELFQLVPLAGDDVILATSRGLVFGTRTPRVWSLLCSEGMGLAAGQAYSIAPLGDGRLLLAATGALRVSDDGGCSFRELARAQDPTPLMVQEPRAPMRIFLVANSAGVAGVYGSEDAGEQLRLLFGLPEGAVARSLLLAPSAAAELYVSWFVEGPTGGREHFVARSIDAGQSWQSRKVELEEGERDLTLLALSPTSPTQLLARASSATPSLGERVLWSKDGSDTFRAVANVRMLRSAGFAADGASIYLGGVDGVVAAQDPVAGFATIGAARWINYVTSRHDALFAAGYYAGIEARLHGIGVLRPSDAAFQPWMSFNEVAALKECPDAPEVARACEVPLRDWLCDHPAYEAGAPSYVEASPREPRRPWPSLDGGPAGSDDVPADAAPDEQPVDAAPYAAAFDASAARSFEADAEPVAKLDATSRVRTSDEAGCNVGAASSWRGALLAWLTLLTRLRRRQRSAPCRSLPSGRSSQIL